MGILQQALHHLPAGCRMEPLPRRCNLFPFSMLARHFPCGAVGSHECSACTVGNMFRLDDLPNKPVLLLLPLCKQEKWTNGLAARNCSTEYCEVNFIFLFSHPHYIPINKQFTYSKR